MLNCEYCRQPYDINVRQRGRGPRFCSQACINRRTASWSKPLEPPPELAKLMTGICNCGCGLPTTMAPRTDVLHKWYIGYWRLYRQGHGQPKGAAHPNFRTGRHKQYGYWVIRLPWHPRADQRGYVGLHILIYELNAGPIPEGMILHHINTCKTNNHYTNLVAVTRGEHSQLHGAIRRERKQAIKPS